MYLRIYSFLLLIFLCTSCNKFSLNKSKLHNQSLDTIVNFTSVDTYPSFKECDSIIDKTSKTDCFRTTIHQKIGAELSQFSFLVKDTISETITVNVIINSKGKIILDGIQSSENITTTFSTLDSILKVSIQNLPTIYPAIKRGIPVTTKYSLPIRIQLKE